MCVVVVHAVGAGGARVWKGKGMGGAAPFHVADEERRRVRAREEERAERGGREAAVDAVAALVHVQLDEGVPAI